MVAGNLSFLDATKLEHQRIKGDLSKIVSKLVKFVIDSWDIVQTKLVRRPNVLSIDIYIVRQV